MCILPRHTSNPYPSSRLYAILILKPGYSFYLASSVLLRRGLSTMYHDLHVELTKMRVTTGGSKPHPDVPTPPPLASDSASKRKSREKSLYMLMKVQGIARVSGNLADWEV